MNAAARVMEQGSWFRGDVKKVSLTRELFAMLSLMVLVLASALAVVYVKNLERQLFSDLQSVQQQTNRIQVEWRQLLLAQSTWSTTARVQKIAGAMGMVLPPSNNVVLVKS
ncbi:MAG: cell division protein FtsL [Proteobacteria bacterium]|nr:cell division protein FtsL [Pseudomonadota bacterium]